MKIRTGDTVVIISGKDKGKQGTVLRVFPEKNRLVVEGANMRVRHIKRTPTQAGQRISYEASLHASNVMILDPKSKKPTRVGYKVDEKTGKKSRVARKSGEMIAKAATTKAAKGSKEKADKKESKKPTGGAPAKSAFWKRGGKADAGEEHASGGKNVDANVIQTAHRAQGG